MFEKIFGHRMVIASCKKFVLFNSITRVTFNPVGEWGVEDILNKINPGKTNPKKGH